jgi:hypothetical protein
MILIVTGSLSLNLCRYNSFIDSQIYMSYLPSFKMSPLISLELSKIPNENGNFISCSGVSKWAGARYFYH